MSSVAQRTINLAEDQAAYIDARVASGDYASGSEVVRAGLEALQDRDDAVERWLRDDVAPAYDAALADPASSIPAEEAFADVRARISERFKGGT